MPEPGTAEKEMSVITDARTISSSPPLIFVSHDSRDAELAEGFSKLLSTVSAGVLKSFRSSDRSGSQGIEYGVEWYPELMSKIEAASDVVCLLTQRSLDRPWILYEAGVAKGKLNTPVHGVAIGIPLNRANSGPFAQFQNCDDNEESLTKLVMQLVRRIPGADPDHDAVQTQVRAFKQAAQAVMDGLADSSREETTENIGDASVAKLFEEVKVMFQDLPSRLESRLAERPMRSRRLRRVTPMMLESFEAHAWQEEGISLLLLAGLLRDDFPWLYEVCMETYRTTKAGNYETSIMMLRQFRDAIDWTLHGPISEEYAMSKDAHMMLHELPMLVDHIFHRYHMQFEPGK